MFSVPMIGEPQVGLGTDEKSARVTPNDLICWPLRSKTSFRHHSPAYVTFKQGETDMGDKGKKDKNKRTQQQKARPSPKEKRKLKNEKKNKRPTPIGEIG